MLCSKSTNCCRASAPPGPSASLAALTLTTHAELVPLPLSELPLEKVSVAAGAFLRHSPRVEQVGQATTAQLIDQPTAGLGKMLTAVIAGDVMGLVLGVLAQLLPVFLQVMISIGITGGWRRRRWWWWCWRSGGAIDGCTVGGRGLFV